MGRRAGGLRQRLCWRCRSLISGRLERRSVMPCLLLDDPVDIENQCLRRCVQRNFLRGRDDTYTLRESQGELTIIISCSRYLQKSRLIRKAIRDLVSPDVVVGILPAFVCCLKQHPQTGFARQVIIIRGVSDNGPLVGCRFMAYVVLTKILSALYWPGGRNSNDD